MDYARFNYVAQPEDGISEKGIFPHIGDYDKWAIDWGDRNFPDIKEVDTERKMLFNLVTDSLRHSPRLYYGEQNFFGLIDARCQSENLSNDVIQANYYGLKNLKRIITLLPKWTSRPGGEFGNLSGNGLRRGYSALLSQYFTYQLHVVNSIGLGYYNGLTLTDSGEIYSPVPKSVQKKAMAFLNTEVFSTEPLWLTPQYISDRVWNPANGVITQLMVNEILTSLISFQRFINIHNSEILYQENQYTSYNFWADLDKGIWPDLKGASQISSFHRSLQ